MIRNNEGACGCFVTVRWEEGVRKIIALEERARPVISTTSRDFIPHGRGASSKLCETAKATIVSAAARKEVAGQHSRMTIRAADVTGSINLQYSDGNRAYNGLYEAADG